MHLKYKLPVYSVRTALMLLNKAHDVFIYYHLHSYEFFCLCLFQNQKVWYFWIFAQFDLIQVWILAILRCLVIFMYYLTMGFLKILAFIAVPISGMTYAAFSLGKELPKASRKFGNYIGLSYIYFKCILKTLKPEDQMPYDMIQMARKASQQSQALRREIRNTVKKAKEDFNRKHEETLLNFEQKIKIQKTIFPKTQDEQSTTEEKSKFSQPSGSEVMRELLYAQRKLAETQKLKKQSRSFYDKI